MPLKRGIDEGAPEGDETEGHMPLRKIVDAGDPVDNDTEGQAVRVRPTPAVTESDDTEGNRIKLIADEA